MVTKETKNMAANKTLSLIIPAYNEEGNLPDLIPVIAELAKTNGWEVIFVNDGSKDNSLQILKEYQEKYAYEVINNKVNKGYGGAIKEGIMAASTDLVITIDADGQHDLNDIKILYDYLMKNDADMVVGKRPDNKSGLKRRLGKFIIRSIAKALMTINITDLNSGMKMYNTKLAKQYLPLCANSMAYSDTIALVFINQKHLVIEHPINIFERKAGSSTISVRAAFQTIIEIFNIVILFNPLNIFLPVSLFFILAGLLWGLRFIIALKGVTVGSMLLITIGILLFFLGLISEQMSKIRKQQLIK
jgi:glycosyltransferase involved in cell wall biosynthesis